MTAIAGLVDDGHVYIGGDSAGVESGGWSLSVRADRKVFRNGPMIFGFTSSFRMGQILRYGLTVPPRADGQDAEAYMVTTFIDAVRAALHTAGFRKREDEVETGGAFLVGYDGKLWSIQRDFQVGRSSGGIDAAGAGHEVVLGSLWSTKLFELSPRARIRLALAAAEANNAAVRSPFHVEELR
jgi:hypothetical protein